MENLIAAIARWWRCWWAGWHWRRSQDDAGDPVDVVVLQSLVRQLSDRPREFITQHCGLTLSPGIADQDPMVFILANHETAFDEPYGCGDLYEILRTFWTAHRVATVVVKEPGKTILAMRVDQAWVLFHRRSPHDQQV